MKHVSLKYRYLSLAG